MKNWWKGVVMVLMGVMLSGCATNPAACLAEVKSGKRQEAKASWWGFNKDDATQCLRDGINSGVKELIVDNVGSDWVVGPIKVPSNIEIVFEDGVVVRAKKGDFKKKTDRLFDINGQKNVILRGEGKVLFVMNKADYQDPKTYEPAEHRHTVNIVNSQNVLVQNLTLEGSGGDGVYVGSSGDGVGAKDIVLERLICENHLRQGISVTGAENLLMKDCKFNNTKGAAPQCGIDYEPNYAKFSLVNCMAENCDFDGNAEAGINLSHHQLDATSRPVSITFKNCRIRGNAEGIRIVSSGNGTPSMPGKIEFINCQIADNPRGSVSIGEHKVGNLTVLFKDCLVDNRKSSLAAVRISSGSKEDLFGIRIEGLTVLDDEKRPPLQFLSRFGNGMVGAQAAAVKSRDSQGTETVFDCAAFLKASAPSLEAKAFQTTELNLKTIVPSAGKGVVSGAGIRYRGKSNYLVYAEPGWKINLKFHNKPVHRYESKPYRDPLSVVVYSPTLAVVGRIDVPFDKVAEYTLDAGERGVYRFEADARMQTLCVETDAHGGVMAGETLNVFGCEGRLYFQVPTGVKEIKIEAGGAPREASTVALLSPEGKELDSGVNLEGSKILRYARQDDSKPEIWSIKFSAQKLFLRIGAPLLPIFSSDPANLLLTGTGAQAK